MFQQDKRMLHQDECIKTNRVTQYSKSFAGLPMIFANHYSSSAKRFIFNAWLPSAMQSHSAYMQQVTPAMQTQFVINRDSKVLF